MQWVDVLREFPNHSDCIPISKKDAKKSQLAVVRDRAYFSRDRSTRQAALKWLDCSASLSQNYKNFFLEALPGYLYLIPEVGRGLFLCISQVISYSHDIVISADLYKNKPKFDKDIYVFVNSNVPDKPFLVTRRQLLCFFGRSPSEHAVEIIEETITKIKNVPEILSSIVSNSDLLNQEGELINPDNAHDLTLMEKIMEDSIDKNPEMPIDIDNEEKKIGRLITSIRDGKVQKKKRLDNALEIYIDKQLKILLEHLRKKSDPKAFSLIDPVILRTKLSLLIRQNQQVQKKQSEDWYADENSLAVPEKTGERSQIELPNIPANNVISNSLNNNRQNQNNVTTSLDEQALNSEEKEEIVEKKEQGWLGFLSSSIGWRGGARKYTKKGGLFEGRFKKLGNTAAKYGINQEKKSLQNTVTRKNRKNVVSRLAKEGDVEDTEVIKSEYDKLYEKVYYGEKMADLQTDWEENLHAGFKEGELSSSVSLATYGTGTIAAVTTATMLGVSNTVISGIATAVGASEALAAVATPVAAGGVATVAVIGTLPALVVATTVGLLMAGLTAAAMTAVGGYCAGLDRAKQLHEIARDSVSSLLIEGAKASNANITKKISRAIMNLEKARSPLFKLDDEKALVWMNRLRVVLAAAAAVVGAAAAAGVKLGVTTAAAWEAKAKLKEAELADAKRKKADNEARKKHNDELFAKLKESALEPKSNSSKTVVANGTRKNIPSEPQSPMQGPSPNNGQSTPISPTSGLPNQLNRNNNAAAAARKRFVAAKTAEVVAKIENGDAEFPAITLIKVTKVPELAALAEAEAAEEAAVAGQNAEGVFESEFTFNFGVLLHKEAAAAKEAEAGNRKVNAAPELPVNNARGNVHPCGTGKRVSVRDM